HGVSGGLLINLKEDGVMTVGRNPDPLRLGRMLDSRNVFEQDDAIGCGAQDGVLDFLELLKARVRNDQIQLVVLLEATDSDLDIRGRERACNLRQSQLERLQFVRLAIN